MTSPAEAYDELSEGYDDFHVDGKSLAENRRMARYLRSFVRPHERVADLGCGTGLLLELLPLPPERYIGVDISEGMLEHARRKHPGHTFVQGDLEHPIPALDSPPCDVALCLFGSASYCDLDILRTTIPRTVRPGGRFLVMFCGPDYLQRKTYINRSEARLTPHTRADLAAAFPGADIWGMSCLVDRVPHTWPAPILDRLLSLDVRVVGRMRPDACFFLNVEGRR